jgi:hypothetical protein
VSNKRSRLYGSLSGGIFLIGTGLIFLLRLPVFPTILAVVGASSALAGLATGRGWEGAQTGLWLLGLALLFHFEIFWPGILILVGLSALLGAMSRLIRQQNPPANDQ